ncbi:hypothetical protein EV361DRAFT_943606, partial [Lentinula raphanica]
LNHSPYGLTASVWSSCSAPFDNGKEDGDREDAFTRITDGIETGTVYLNRCDYLDPAFLWTGVSLSQFG